MGRGHLLLVDGDAARRTVIASGLTEQGFDVHVADTAEVALQTLEQAEPDAVLAGLGHAELWQRIPEHRPGLPVVVLCEADQTETLVEALRSGAHDFLRLPFHPDVAALTLDRALAHARLRGEVRLLRRRARLVSGLGSLVGESASIRRLFELVARVADTTSSVLITGESGTGKELVARELHKCSRRKDGPFVAVNCAAMPENLLESELFGHTKGAFTDARETRTGLFAKARGGTLFLDEIGDMPQALQSKLLRALQDRTIRPVGSDEEVPVDVRVVAATHRDLDALVDAGRFRDDLLYRLDVIRLEIPPLRDRGDDVLVLAQRFLEVYARQFERPVTGFEPEATRRLLSYRWPGNVRELQNCVERAVVLAEHEHVGVDDLPRRVRESAIAKVVSPPEMTPENLPTLVEIEAHHVRRVLDAVGGNKSRAARILGIDRKTLHRKLGQIATAEAG